MTVNGLTLLLAAAALIVAWRLYTRRTALARRRRTAHLRDRVGASLVAGYVHGLEAWLDHQPAPREPIGARRPVWHATLGLEDRLAGGIELEQLAYEWARHAGWQAADTGVLPPVLPDPLAGRLHREHFDRATRRQQIPTLHDELANIHVRARGRAR